MKNFYNKKYDELVTFGYNINEAISELYSIYLKHTHHSLSDDFWKSKLFLEHYDLMLNNEFFMIALFRTVKSNKLIDKQIIKHLINTDLELLKKIIRYSKMYLEKDNINYLNIKEMLSRKELCQDFISICEKLQNKKYFLQSEIKRVRSILNQFGYLDLICFISMYMMKNSKNNFDPCTFETNMEVLTSILLDRLETKDRRKREIDEFHIKEKFDTIFTSDPLYKQYHIFEEIVNVYENDYNFEENIIVTFSYNDNYYTELKNNELTLRPKCIDEFKKWFKDGEKLSLLFQYYHKIAEDLTNKKFGGIDASVPDITKKVFVNSIETQLLIKNIYGLDEEFFISDDYKIQLSKCIHSINELKGFYQKFFLSLYFKHFNNEDDWYNAALNTIYQGHEEGLNRLPLNYQEVGKFAQDMNDETENISLEDRLNIEKFWTIDLRKINRCTDECITNVFEKPLMKLDNYIFTMPYFIGHQKSSMTFINALFKIHNKRQNFRREEVFNSTQNLKKLFDEAGFDTRMEYSFPNYKGDIDLLCEKDGFLFILELKSTYTRQCFENIWHYKNSTLLKAGHQLQKRKIYLNKLLEEPSNPIWNEISYPKKIYYWIIDTSFEFDHTKFFDSSKKVR